MGCRDSSGDDFGILGLDHRWSRAPIAPRNTFRGDSPPRRRHLGVWQCRQTGEPWYWLRNRAVSIAESSGSCGQSSFVCIVAANTPDFALSPAFVYDSNGSPVPAPIGDVAYAVCFGADSMPDGKSSPPKRARVARQVRGEEVIELLPGGPPNYTAPDVVRWHGAAPDEYVVQLTFMGGASGEDWFEPVSDNDYRG